MLNEFRSTLITWDKATSRIYSTITANASDENGRKLVVQIVNSGQVEDLTGATLHLYWETRDKAHDGLDVFKAVDLKKGEFELSYTTGMLSNHGVLNANLVLIDTVGRVVSERFKITVTEGIDNDAIQSENSFSSLTQALIDISNLEQNYAPRLNDLTAQLQQTEQELSSQLAQKLTKGEVSVADINKNKGKFDQSYLSDTLLQQITGTAPVNTVPADDSITSKKLTNNSVLPDKTNFAKRTYNLIDVDKLLPKTLITAEGTEVSHDIFYTSKHIDVEGITSITFSHTTYRIVFYDTDRVVLSVVSTTGVESVTVPQNTKTMRLSVELKPNYYAYSGNEFKPYIPAHSFDEDKIHIFGDMSNEQFIKETTNKKHISTNFDYTQSPLNYGAKEFISLSFESGSINGSTGENGPVLELVNPIRWRTRTFFLPTTTSNIVVKNPAYRYSLITYKDDGSVTDTGWKNTSMIISYKPNSKYRLNLSKVDNSVITPKEIESISDVLVITDGVIESDVAESNKQINKIDFSFVRGIAHRGLVEIDDAENTLESLENAFYSGAKIVEIDVRRCSGGDFVLCHDSSIDRTSDGTGFVTQYTLDELRAFDFGYEGGTKLPKYDYQILIPTLEEYLMKAKEYGIQVALDFIIDVEYIDEVFKIIEKCRMKENVYWHLGTFDKMKAVLSLDNQSTVLFGTSTLPSDFSNLLELKTSRNQIGVTTQWTNFQQSNGNLETNLSNLRKALDAGLFVHAYTVNNHQLVNAPNVIDDMISYGISAIGTDELLIEPNRRIIANLKSQLNQTAK